MILIRRSVNIRVFSFLVILSLPFNLSAVERWYDEAQVDTGKSVFNTYCSICHGIEAAGTPKWQNQMSDGRYPAPPLNGTAHAWHHKFTALRRQINRGGAEFGGWMPSLAESLKAEQVDAVIAYIQSFWPDKIYTAWLKKNPDLSSNVTAKDQSVQALDKEAILLNLRRRLPESKFGEPEETPLAGIYRLAMDDSVIYVSSDGRFVFLGDMVDLISGRNITKSGVP